MVGYLNTSILRNKITDLNVFMRYVQLDYFVVSETSFPSAQFMMLSSYEVSARSDIDKNGGGLIEHVKAGVVCKRLRHFEIVILESIFQS